jgi:hypothetical protein
LSFDTTLVIESDLLGVDGGVDSDPGVIDGGVDSGVDSDLGVVDGDNIF